MVVVVMIMMVVNDCSMSKLLNSSFMLTSDCKLCHLSSKGTKNILDVCEPLHVMSFSPNPIIFHG
ncbi:hypothetical protein Hanom_Chr05g00409051 [Helianthus anomalus]